MVGVWERKVSAVNRERGLEESLMRCWTIGAAMGIIYMVEVEVEVAMRGRNT